MILDDIADMPAARGLTACTVETPIGAQLAAAHGVRPEHFPDPALAAVFAVAVERVEIETLIERIEAIATATARDVGWLEDLVNEPRKCYRDDNGALARRVLAAADRLQRYHEHVDGLTSLGIGVAA